MAQAIPALIPSSSPRVHLRSTSTATTTIPKSKSFIITIPRSPCLPRGRASRSLISASYELGNSAAAAPNGSEIAGVVIEVDAVSEVELKENGFRSTHRTKLVCTIGPATSKFSQIEALAMGGMNVARINMCHGTREWHRDVISKVRKLNEEKGFSPHLPPLLETKKEKKRT